jgi:hypothetical protein
VATTKKTKKKAKKKVASDGASEADFLLEMAEQTAGTAKSTSGDDMPLVEMPQHAEAIAALVDAQAQIDKYTGIKKEMTGEILEDAEEARIIASRAAGEALSSIKIVGGDTGPAIRVTHKNAYSGMNLMKKSEAIAALAESLPCDSEVAEEMFTERTKMVTTISLKPAAFKDKAAIVAMKKYLKNYLVVKVVAKPTDEFHRQATLQPNEHTLMEILSDFLNPHNSSVAAKNVKR